MEAHLHEWASLLIRWLHLITGIAWIGASFYFNWLENHLERLNKPEKLAGDLWAVHGGGFYYLKKFKVGPPQIPETLHWFKWEAYWTWISGFTLLCLVYYANARAYMISPDVAELTPITAIGIGIGSLLLSWFFYDLICKSPLSSHNTWLAIIIFAYFIALAWGLSQLLSGRAAYLHVGAAIGTIMVANVFRVIIPSQKHMVAEVSEGRMPDPTVGKNALLRSRHNNYFTLPVLFIMISTHYPFTFGHDWNWLVLVGIAAVGVLIRHYFNIRHLPKANSIWLVIAFIGIVALALGTRPKSQQPISVQPLGESASNPAEMIPVKTADILPIIKERCTNCHSAQPSFAGFAIAPQDIKFDTTEEVEIAADRIYNATVLTKTMPLGNLTQMTEEERQQITAWWQARQ